MHSNKKVTFPEYNHYNYVFKYFIEHGLDAEYVMAPPMTVRTWTGVPKTVPTLYVLPLRVLWEI